MAITGPDGAGKSTTTRMVSLRLGQDLDLIQPGPSRPVYAVQGGQIRYPYLAMIAAIHRLHHVADCTRTRFAVAAVNALNVLFCARVVEPSLVRSLRPGLVLGARDFRADASVYAAFYLPWVGRLSMSARLSWMGRLTGAPFNDAVFFLTVPPREAIRRIDARIAAEEADPARIVETRSWRWRHLHEDPETLAALQRAYYGAFRILQRRWPVHVYEIDTETLSQAQVVEFIVATIRDCLRDRSGIPASPRWVRHSAAGTSVMPT